MFFDSMDPSWQQLLAHQRGLLDQIQSQVVDLETLTPGAHQVMRAFELPVSNIRVLLIGQDPYPTKGVACGLAFAVSENSNLPQSLKNLMKELENDIAPKSANGHIQNWMDQGVLPLNASLTTEVGVSGAHQLIWREFTAAAITALDEKLSGKLVCLSLGEQAKKLSSLLKNAAVVQAVHPSPLSVSRGFFGSKIYSRVNHELIQRGLRAIDWSC
jgi:uracil-DNA glycosylase